MKKIRNFVINTISFFNSKYLLKYLFSISICLLGLFLFGMFTNDTLSNLLGIIFGFIISHLLLGIFTLISAKLEDPTKVTDDQKKLLKIYSHKSCSKEVELNNTKTTILYKDLLVNNNYNIKVVDEPENIFTPDDFIMDNFHPLLSAHRFSSISNRNTVRLNSCKQTSKNEYTLTLGRSTYFNHLITNRVADYKLESGISIRDYYEFGPDISSPEESKMSNHIGIIALIYLKDGELLLPRRKDTSTISKNKITSSIAMPLRIPETNNISTEYLLKDCIIDGIVSRTKLDRHYLKEDEIDIEFLGCGQEIYELGKPHLFYKVVLKNINREQYITHLIKNVNEDKLDQDKYIYVAKKDTLKFVKEFIEFDYYKCKIKNGKLIEKMHTVKCSYENAFACNIWHENQLNNKNINKK